MYEIWIFHIWSSYFTWNFKTYLWNYARKKRTYTLKDKTLYMVEIIEAPRFWNSLTFFKWPSTHIWTGPEIGHHWPCRWLGTSQCQAISWCNANYTDVISSMYHWLCIGRWQSNGISSIWPWDTIWWHRSGSTLAQVMACCLTALSHYLNQCWFFGRIQWHSAEGNVIRDTSSINH